MSDKEILGKKIASFIALSVVISTPVVAEMVHVDGPVARYAGPEYFGFTVKGAGTVKTNPDIPINDIAPYTQIPAANSPAAVNNANMVNINAAKPNANFVNSEYGSVKVIEQSSHYIFK